jgi:hypothetical protein
MMNARRQPLCVERNRDDYYVVLSHEQEDEVKSYNVQLTMDQTPTATAEQHIKAEQGHVPDLQLSQTALHLDHLLRSSKILSTNLQSSSMLQLRKGHFPKVAANGWYYYSKTLEELERLEGLGITVQADGMTKEQLCANVHHLQQELTLYEFENDCKNLLDFHEIEAYFPAPRLFLVLPADLDSWIDSDSTTHLFRLYFLCDISKNCK